MERNDYCDPNLILRLGQELQQRIGTLPVVEPYALCIGAQPGELVRMLRVQPKSYSEISRTIRAARSLKLTVRACGEQSGGNLGIYGSASTVLVDCSSLADSPRIEFVNVRRQNETSEMQGLRILSCVRIDELVAFQISHNIEIFQSAETLSNYGTVVGAIVSTASGVVGPSSGAIGGCLCDEVISLRIVNSQGDLKEYSSVDEISAAVSSLGLLGIVYDVTLRYNPIGLSKVEYSFHKWSELLNDEQSLLKSFITENNLIELIYLPYNSYRNENENNNKLKLQQWNPLDDEIFLRRSKKLTTDINCKNNPECTSFDSDARQSVNIIDKVFGPNIDEFIQCPNNTPKLLKNAHHYLRAHYCTNSTSIQYTPWVLNAWGKMIDPLRILKYTMETDHELNEFKVAINAILNELRELSGNGSKGNGNFSINLGLRVHFTGGTKNGRLLGVGLESPDTQRKNLLLAHITFIGITTPGPNTLWTKAANRINMIMLTKIPACVPQWKSEWHGIQLMRSKFRDKLINQIEPLKKLCALADRDGMFMNELLESILYPKLTFYQELYRSERENILNMF